jgi:hypothetical protein
MDSRVIYVIIKCLIFVIDAQLLEFSVGRGTMNAR